MSYTCPSCGAVSHNPNDERERYCGRCHQFEDLMPALSDAPDTIEYHGKQRQVVGRLQYREPPEPGTIIGPNGWGERCVVLGAGLVRQQPTIVADGFLPCTLIGLATFDDIARATNAIVEGGPRSELEQVTTWNDFLDGFAK